MILCVLLIAVAAPLYLIATVVASFAATLGLVTLLFSHLFGHEGLAFNLELISFIFLVALGVDYNIFLMDRVRDEARMWGTREGTLRALTSTGGVVTSAGIILAGTFASLTLLPLEPLVQIGATVSLGVLIDAFVVRALLVPSLTYLIGDRAWWPFGAGRRKRNRWEILVPRDSMYPNRHRRRRLTARAPASAAGFVAHARCSIRMSLTINANAVTTATAPLQAMIAAEVPIALARGPASA